MFVRLFYSVISELLSIETIACVQTFHVFSTTQGMVSKKTPQSFYHVTTQLSFHDVVMLPP